MNGPAGYRGRFAPSPTGPLHFGSLVAALGSYLDARHRNGRWLVRMEDLDPPREVAGAADDILATLDAFGLHWDEPVMYQSLRTEAYESALEYLANSGRLYGCACTRKEIADGSTAGRVGIYPGTCRNGLPPGRDARASRVRVDRVRVEVTDRLQGEIAQDLDSEVGDFILKRADGLFAYQLAVVVDDAEQAITDIVRGADLLHSTPRQRFLQQCLDLPEPAYMHLPIAVNTAHEKLGKQTHAHAVRADRTNSTLVAALEFLRQPLPDTPTDASRDELLDWAIRHWNVDSLASLRAAPAPVNLSA